MNATFNLAERLVVNPESSVKPKKNVETANVHGQSAPWKAIFSYRIARCLSMS